MKFWKTIQSELDAGHNLVLLYVIESNGSSPGRQGFKMAVSQSGLLTGSIGGGIMEHKLVEFCKAELLKAPFEPFLKKQIHQTDIPANKSGMICSGEQIIAIYHFGKNQLSLVQEIIKKDSSKNAQLILSNIEIKIIEAKQTLKFQLELGSNEHWKLKEQLNFSPVLHIIGGGHVSLALSQFAKETGFSVTVYDDRSNLNTVTQNIYANSIQIKSYDTISKLIPKGINNYVVIMSFGYKTDKIILKSLLSDSFAYLGIMGSQAKITTLFKEILREGVNKNELAKVFAPIGFAIASKTPQEIAISILAQVIEVKNK